MSKHVTGLMLTFGSFSVSSYCLMSSIQKNDIASAAFCGLFAISQMCMFLICFYRLTGEA